VPMFSSAFQWHYPIPPSGSAFTIIVDLLRPLSKGEVKLNSANPLQQANINLNFFGEDLDILAMREGVRWTYDVLTKGEGMKDVVVGDYPWEMPIHSDEAMNKVVLERSQTGFRKCLHLPYVLLTRLICVICRPLWHHSSLQDHYTGCCRS